MFHCLPSDNKCEWAKLKGFVKQFNETFNTDYTLAECLDVVDRNTKQPEILLKSPNHKSMVIEHKVLVWPKDYLKFHRTEHEFKDFFFERFDSQLFHDSLYWLELNPRQLRGTKQKIKQIAYQIADTVVKNRERIGKAGGVKSSAPIKWIFREISRDEVIDEDAPVAGVGIQFIEPSSYYDEDFEEQVQEAKKGIVSQLKKKLRNTSLKFQGYADCLKVLVIEMHGNTELFMSHEVEELMKVVKIPSNIDQIWSTDMSFISESRYEVVYHQIK